MRLLRPLLWLVTASAALAGFVALGGSTDVPIRWGDLGAWLDEAGPEGALVEVVRWAGVLLAVYVIAVAMLVLLSELAAAAQVGLVARLLHGVASAVSFGALRRRLVEASTATAITVSAMSATGGGVGLAVAPVAGQTVAAPATPALDAALVLPPGISAADVTGFGVGISADSLTTRAATEARMVVADGDTMWDLLVDHYGYCDAALIDLVAAASGITDPSLIYTGQVLVLPALAGPTPAASPSTPSVPLDAATWAMHTIVVGDTLWDILEAHYGYVDGDLVWLVAGYNGIEDPSDVPVGTAITLPPVADGLVVDAVSVPVPVPEPVSPAPAVEVPAAPAPVLETVVAEHVPELTALPPSDTVPVDGEVEPLSEQAAPPVVASATTDRTGTGSVESSGEADGDGTVAPWLAGLVGTTTLSVGLAAAYRRLRRRQTASGSRAWRLLPSGESARLHRALVAAADLPLVRWAGQELSGVLFGLGRPVAGPVAVELSDLTGIELLWDEPMPSAPAPWEATPGGWSWRLLYDDSAEVPEAVLPAAVPGLVTLGRRDDAQFLVDVEAFGSVSITGDPRAAEDVMRSVVLELGSGDELSDAWVSTVGLGVDGVEQLGRVQARSEAEVLHHARAIIADERRLMDEAGVANTFVLRASGPPATREVSVIAVRADSCSVVDELLALAEPRTGLAVVVLGVVDGAGLRVSVDAAGCVELDPLGVVLDAVRVSHEAAANTAVLLEAAAQPVEPEDLSEAVNLDDDEGDDDNGEPAPRLAEVGGDDEDLGSLCDLLTTSADPAPAVTVDDVTAVVGPDGVDLVAAGELLSADDDDQWVAPSPALLVRVLGEPRLEPAPTSMSRLERLVVVYVATMGGEAPAARVRDAVWKGRRRSDKTFTNTLSRIRAQLGPGIVPGRLTDVRSGDDGAAPVRLADTLTDLDVFESMVAHAHQLPSSEALAMLSEALELVTGEPFDDTGCEWPNIEQLRFRASHAIEDATVRAVELALAADDLVAARHAVSHGLLGLPGNEVLYRARMRIEAQAGNRAAVRSVYSELLSVLEDLGGDSQDAGDPSPVTRQLYEKLVAGGQREGPNQKA